MMAALMYPLTMRYGIMGAAVAAMLPSVLVVVLTLREAGKIIGKVILPGTSFLRRPGHWSWHLQYVAGRMLQHACSLLSYFLALLIT